MSNLTKDEAANLDWALMALAKNAGYVLPSEKATAIQEVLETQAKRIAALERENAELHQVCKDWKQLHENNEGCIAGLRAELQRSHEPKMGLSSEEHQMIARLCDTSHEAVAAYERRFQIRGSLFGPIDNEMIALRDASARMIVSAINGGRKHPETLQGRDEVAWLIEQSFNSKAHWWYGSDFTDDAAQAVRFARKQDADQVILERGMVDAVASEHMWCQFETSGLCPHGMPLAENICGPCSEGKPNRPASNTGGSRE